MTEKRKAEEALLESEEIFSYFMENSPIYVFFKDADTRSLRLSKNYEQMLGRPLNELLGKTMDDLFPSDLAKKMIQDDLKILNDGKPSLFEEELNGKFYSTVKFPIIIEGKPKYLAGFTIDITERKIAEKALQKSHKKLEKSKLATINLLEDINLEMDQRKHVEEELSKLNDELEHRVTERTAQLEAVNNELQAFAYSVSHDLRAPLRAIDGFSKFMLDDYGTKLDPEGKRLLGLIRSNTQKMDQLIIDILALSKVTRSEHKVSKVDMTKMVMSMLNEIASPEIQANLSILIDPLQNAYVDPTYIKQVWINLISNAIKFSSLKNKPEIKIGSFVEKGFHVYYIKDNGVGFNPEYAHKLFGVFQRLHKVDEFEGTGVGLAIVKRIVIRHGGKVWAEGAEGKGATFYFSIPVKSGE